MQRTVHQKLTCGRNNTLFRPDILVSPFVGDCPYNIKHVFICLSILHGNWSPAIPSHKESTRATSTLNFWVTWSFDCLGTLLRKHPVAFQPNARQCGLQKLAIKSSCKPEVGNQVIIQAKRLQAGTWGLTYTCAHTWDGQQTPTAYPRYLWCRPHNTSLLLQPNISTLGTISPAIPKSVQDSCPPITTTSASTLPFLLSSHSTSLGISTRFPISPSAYLAHSVMARLNQVLCSSDEYTPTKTGWQHLPYGYY